ncbi:13714_t:CDS:2, partial [Funneliformis mosseae]
NITVLTNIYKNTRNIQSLVHAVKGPSIPRTELELKVVIRNILDALVGLHELGYVHRDIQWPNILRLNDYSWILIDLECAGVSGEKVQFKPLEGWAPETNETEVYITKADVYMVGRLLSKIFFSLSEEAREFEKATTTNLKFRLTAQEARQHSWLSDIQE